MQHDDVVTKDLFQVMEAFPKVKDADGKMVGPAFKTMKSEFVAWQEAISVNHDKCLCIRGYVDHRRVDTQQAQEPIGAAKCGERCSCP